MPDETWRIGSGVLISTGRGLHGTGPTAGQRCILRITTDANGRLRSEIVYFYGPAVAAADLDADFDLLARGGMVSMGQLHHSEAMMNRGRRVPR